MSKPNWSHRTIWECFKAASLTIFAGLVIMSMWTDRLGFAGKLFLSFAAILMALTQISDFVESRREDYVKARNYGRGVDH